MEQFTREEADSIGTRQVPKNAYYGVQSLRAQENFSITGGRVHPEMIRSLARLKKACALANAAAGTVDKIIAKAIALACDKILVGEFHDQFIVDPIQGGAGTSINMNANEVIANIAIEILGGEKGDYSIVHPNDHVNYGQSTNDVIPTAGKMTALVLLQKLEDSLQMLCTALQKKAGEFDSILKMGRNSAHMPQQSAGAWSGFVFPRANCITSIWVAPPLARGSMQIRRILETLLRRFPL